MISPLPPAAPEPPTGPIPAMNPPKPSRKPLWIGLAVLIFVAAAATGGTLLRTTAATTTPVSRPIAIPTTVPLAPGPRFVKDVLDTPGLTTDMGEAELIGMADKICDAIGTPGVTRQNLTDAMGTTKFGPVVAKVLVDAAANSYCPEKSYSTVP